jgi:hypothetical protein
LPSPKQQLFRALLDRTIFMVFPCLSFSFFVIEISPVLSYQLTESQCQPKYRGLNTQVQRIPLSKFFHDSTAFA